MKFIGLATISLLILFFQGCSTKTPEVKDSLIVFPTAPAEARIAYLDTYRGEKEDEKAQLNALDKLLGETIESKSKSPIIIKPYGVTIDSGVVYAVDTASRFVFAINAKTRDAIHIGRTGAGQLGGPVDVAVDKDGLVYVSDMKAKKILVYSNKGVYLYAFGSRLELTHPTGMAIDKKLHRLYVADTKAHKIKVFDLSTKKLIAEIGKRGKGDGEFNFLTNIAIDRRNSNIVVADTQNFRVQVFDKDGKFLLKFGKVGDRAGDFSRPKGIGVDSEGHIYVADTAFNNVQIFDEKGTLMLWFGHSGYTEPGTFRLVAGLYIDENDQIVISDGFTGRIQTFQYLSKVFESAHPAEFRKYKELNENPKESDIPKDAKEEKKVDEK